MSWRTWSEGMLLRPQHFQHSGRHTDHVQHLLLRTTASYGWGFAEIEIDAAALALGRLALVRAVGVFGDGTVFEMPAVDPLPDPIEVPPDARNASFVLAVQSQMPSEALRTRFPTQVKIGPVERIRDLVNLALPGISLVPLPVAQRQIPYHAGASYFELETHNSDLWRQFEQSGRMAMHIAGDFPGLEIAFWAIRT